MNSKNHKNTKNLFRIIVPVLILCIIAGIWFLKNSQEDTLSFEPDNPDFALNVDDSFDLEKLKSYGLPIIIEFGDDFCAPCWEMKPIIAELNEELQGKAIIKYVDTFDYKDIADDFPLSGIPTQAFYDSEGNPYNPENPNHPWMNLYDSPETGEHSFTTHKGTISKEELLEILVAMGMSNE